MRQIVERYRQRRARIPLFASGQPDSAERVDELLEMFENRDVAAALDVISQYEDLNIGLPDASLVVLSQRHRLSAILTLDERHFRVLRAWNGGAFRVPPADSPR